MSKPSTAAGQWALFIDIPKCNGCFNCFIAAKDEYVDNAEPGYFAAQPRHGQAWIDVKRFERGRTPIVDAGYIPTMCMHCDDAPCLKAARNGAVEKRADGIVIIVPEKAKGQRAIVDACPYGAVFWNEDAQIPQAWPFDAHLLDRGWEQPRCAQSCVTGAIIAEKGDSEALRAKAAREGFAPLQPELGTRPRVFYRGLDTATKAFIGGTVFIEKNGVQDCAEGAIIQVSGGGMNREAKADAFGEFKVDGLEPGSGRYTVAITYGSLAAAALTADLTGTSQVLETVVLRA